MDVWIKCVFLFIIVISYLTDCRSQIIIEAPVNTAAMVNTQARMNYTANPEPNFVVTWEFYYEGSATIVYDSVNGISSKAQGYYEVDEDVAIDQYDLVIPNVQPELAGRYKAGFALTNDPLVEPELVVLSEMICDPDHEEIYDKEETLLEFTCSVQYHGYMAPSLKWVDDSGTEVVGNWYINNTQQTVSLTANVTTNWERDEYVFTCNLQFVASDGDTAPPPVFTQFCQSRHTLLYPPNHIEIFPDPTHVLDMQEGEQIVCTSNGNPYPTYTWYCDGSYYTQGNILAMEGDLVRGVRENNCICTATNIINGIQSGMFKSVAFRACRSCETDIDECASNQCLVNSTCEDRLGFGICNTSVISDVIVKDSGPQKDTCLIFSSIFFALIMFVLVIILLLLLRQSQVCSCIKRPRHENDFTNIDMSESAQNSTSVQEGPGEPSHDHNSTENNYQRLIKGNTGSALEDYHRKIYVNV